MGRKTKRDAQAVAEKPRKLGRPKGARVYSVARLEKPLAEMARAIATARGVSVGFLLSEYAGDAIRRDYAKVVAGREV